MKRSRLTELTGQDGSYLAELLLNKGYAVHGLTRRAATFNTSRIDHLCVEGMWRMLRVREAKHADAPRGAEPRAQK